MDDMEATTVLEGSDRRDYRALLYIFVLAAFICAIYYTTYASIVDLWGNSEYRYGALVFPITALLLWISRRSLATVRLTPWAPGLILMAGLVVTWYVSRATGVQVTEQLAAVVLIPAAVLTLLGLQLFRRALFPLLFLIAIVPMADWLIPHLMRVTAWFSTALIQLIGVPVFRDGQFISLPHGNFEIADVCSGLNYLVAGTMVALLFAYLTYRSQLKRVIFVAVAAVLLVIANGLRAFIVMTVASATHMKYLSGRDHVWFGWILFGIIIVALFAIASRWADAPEEATTESAGTGAIRPRIPVLPLSIVLVVVLLAATAQRFQASIGSSWKLLLPAGLLLLWLLYKQFKSERLVGEIAAQAGEGDAPGHHAGAVIVLLIGVALLVAGPLANRSMERPVSVHTAFQWLPIDGCTGPDAWKGPWQPSVSKPDYSGSATFSCDGQPVKTFVAGFFNGGQGREVVNEQYPLFPKRWRTPGVGVMAEPSFATSDGQIVQVKEIQLAGATDGLIWYWYRAGDRTATSGLGVKILQGVNLLQLRGAGSSVYLLVTPLDKDLATSRQRLTRVARALEADHPAHRLTAAHQAQ